MASQFSAFVRPSIIAKLQHEEFDLLVIGGGITGAGIALDAASRGLRVALVEKNDFAFGTSSRSTKLIHGGLRYLKQLEFGLVKEVGSERAVVHKLAPHLVLPEKMLLPLFERRGLGYWMTSIGLRIYDWLAGVKSEDQRKMLTRQQTLKCEPLLRKDDIKGSALYAEYRTDDARLTIEIIKAAFKHGACIASYLKVTDFLYAHERVGGVKVNDKLLSTSFEIKANVIVNAAGPWVDDLRERDKSKQGKRLHLTKGVHIVVDWNKLPVQQAIYFDVDDGRMIFAIPRGGITYIGTTDTNYQGDKDSVIAKHEDGQYLLDAVNAMFPSVNLNKDDIESSWAGLRPLIHEEGKSASELSRKDEIFRSPSGLISIAGGKLTGYRKMAERVVNLVIESHYPEKELKPCFTHTIKLSAFHDARQVNDFVKQKESEMLTCGLPLFYASYLVYNYGAQVNEVMKLFSNNKETNPEVALTLAELEFTLQHEMVLTPLDFFIRRTGMLYFNLHRLEQMKDIILAAFKKYFNWSDIVLQEHQKNLASALDDCVALRRS